MADDPEQRKAQTTATFNRLAADYDAAGVGCFAYFGRRLVDVVGIAPGQSVLDVAMLEAARQAAAARGLSAELRVMDAEQLDFADGTFDRVLCGFGVMFFPHLATALAEMRRVLKPDGRMGLSTWRVSQTHDLTAVLDALGVGGPPAPGWITDPAELAHILVEAGFRDVEVRIAATTFRYDDLEQYWRNARGTGERRRLATLDAPQAEQVRRALTERLGPRQRPDGLYVEASALFGLASR